MLTGDKTEKLASRIAELYRADAQFAGAQPVLEVAEAMVRAQGGLPEVMRTAIAGYSDRAALGQRAIRVQADPVNGRRTAHLLAHFDTITYAQLWDRVTAVARTLAAIPVGPGQCIATLGFASVDYTTVDMAVALQGAVSVPLHAGAPVEQLNAMVCETEPVVIACSVEYLAEAVELTLGDHPPATLLVFDHYADVDDHQEALDAARKRLAAAGSTVIVQTLDETVQQGRTRELPEVWHSDSSRLALVIYTSGSSGSPKGAMQPEAHVAAAWKFAAGAMIERNFAIPSITLNYMPMSHTAGRSMLYSTLGVGGTAYFAARSDLSTLLDDLALTRPTQLNFVPRVWGILHSHFQREVDRRCADGTQPAAVESDVFDEIRQNVLGGRYISALTGSAPISAELSAWVEVLLDIHLMDALGATESGSVVVDGRVQRPPVTEYRLRDVPELGYFRTDRPYPRGELAIKSTALFVGYYKRPDVTAEVFDGDGFYLTGDIVAEVGPDQVEFVDRRNNVLKLPQGEFVTVSKLEAVYCNSALVRQIYLYGNSARSYLLAVVVPTEDALARHDITSLRELIITSLQAAARTAGLQPYEMPRDVVLETTPFTLDNGLLTGIRKLARPKLKQTYEVRLEQLYADLADREATELRALRQDGAGRPVTETVCRAVGALLGTGADEVASDAHFTDLGGDSLSALTFANLLHDIFRIDVPVGVIVSPASDLAAIADYIESQRHGDTKRPTFASVHGRDAAEAHASDLTPDKFLDAETLSTAALPGPTGDPRTVLLTGATGFLGRYLALEWLQRMKEVGGTVICLVRAKDDAAARVRLGAVFDGGDPKLRAHYRDLAGDHLEVIAGDKGATGLGLQPALWQRLAESVDLIVDPAALVNHMLPYSELFGPNVAGTAELIRLGITTKIKPVIHASTIGVGASLSPGAFVEDADIRAISPTRRVDDSYANGYANSKWAGEVLLREAHDLCGLPVSVFRCGMILADTSYRGQLNLPDMFTRLMLSLVATGVAPYSFYQLGADGGRQPAHYDALPVEFIAKAMSTLGAQVTAGFHTYHTINPHDDDISLDTYVDWLIDAGYPIRRVADYSQWYARMESALRNLPQQQRQYSLLPLIQSYGSPQRPLKGSFASADRFRAAVQAARMTPSQDIPHITAPVITKYITDLELLGLIRSPTTTEGA
jgi:fatty acid CoA ligase FadD9